jgi:hypothetical protein
MVLSVLKCIFEFLSNFGFFFGSYQDSRALRLCRLFNFGAWKIIFINFKTQVILVFWILEDKFIDFGPFEIHYIF